jgi:hypothetical protein
MTVHGGRIYVATAEQGVKVLDIRDPARILPVGGDHDGGDEGSDDFGAMIITDVALRGARLVASTINANGLNPGGLVSFGLADPERPAELDSLVDIRTRTIEVVVDEETSFEQQEGELGGMRLAVDGERVFSRQGGRVQAYHAGRDGLALLDEARLPAAMTGPLASIDTTGSLIAATGGLAVVPTRSGLAVFRLQPR